MSAADLSHPDRLAATLANLAEQRARRPAADCLAPGAGSADCRIDLKLWQWRARRAAQRSPAAQAHLDAFPESNHPDLWAGTVQDGVARGFAVRLEEATALASPDPVEPIAPMYTADGETTVFDGKQLRRKKDILVASGSARIRYSRKAGLLFVDRDQAIHSENFLWFEARRDLGTLDGFVGAPDERARLFSAQFLQPQHYKVADDRSELVLAGRLSRGPVGWPCRVLVQGHAHESALRLQIEILAAPLGWRLRARFLGMPPGSLHHACVPVREVVEDQRGFVADTLVRSCETLLVDGQPIAVPDAATPGRLCHDYRLGTEGD